MARYKITVGDKSFECEDDTYILDAAEEAGLKLPYSCRAGSCSSCVCAVKSGTIDQSDQSFLTDAQIARGFFLSCVAYPKSDVVMASHLEEFLSVIDSGLPKPKFVDDNFSAAWHYFNGNGGSVNLGPKTHDALRNSARQQQALQNLKSGNTTKSGGYGVNLTTEIFHVGETLVRYNTVCSGGFCTTHFRGFLQKDSDGTYKPDSFRDPFWFEETTGTPVELPGGTPYSYIPYEWSETYPDPWK